jgi:Major Facilitator Superfamily
VRPRGFWLMAASLLLFMAASIAPSPLYVVYQAEWHLSAGVLAGVYAVYMVPLIAALVTVGGISDDIGRRPVLVTSLLLQAAAMVVLMTAPGVPALFAGRIVQGVATGAAMGAVTSGMLDLAPPARPHLGALLNGIVPAVGIGSGAALSGLLVQFAPAPTVTVYVVLGVAFVALAVAVLIRVAPMPRVAGFRHSFRPRLGVPVRGRKAFLLLVPGVVASAGMGGFYNALSSAVVADVLHEANRSIAGFTIAAVQVCAVAASSTQPSSGRASRQIFAGSLVLAAGLAAVVGAVFAGSTPAFLVATGVAGGGYGVLYLGAVRTVALLAPPGRRADVLAALNVVNYLSLSIPSVLAGVAIAGIGLRTASVVFCTVLAALAMVSAVLQRPTNRPPEDRREGAPTGACRR